LKVAFQIENVSSKRSFNVPPSRLHVCHSSSTRVCCKRARADVASNFVSLSFKTLQYNDDGEIQLTLIEKS